MWAMGKTVPEGPAFQAVVRPELAREKPTAEAVSPTDGKASFLEKRLAGYPSSW